MFHRRFRSRRNARKHVFSKRAEKAIQRIAQKPVETKSRIYSEDLATLTRTNLWNGLSGYAYVHNLLNSLPKNSISSSDQEDSVIGHSCQLRGVSIKWRIAYPAPFTTGVTAPGSHMLKVRLTVFSHPWFSDTVVAPSRYEDMVSGTFLSPTPTGTTIIRVREEDSESAPTFWRYNTEEITVHKSRSFTLSGGGQRNFMNEGKMWVPLRRKITSILEDTTEMGPLKDRNYYLAVEFYDPFLIVSPAATNSLFDFRIEEEVYFKDA